MVSKKITVIGAGNVGATCANILATRNIVSEIVLLDVKKDLAEGKAIDIMQSATLLGINTHVKGVTDDYFATENSDVVIITSGIPRKPGMTREELLGVNKEIVVSVLERIFKHSPKTILIIISNPMDAMCFLANCAFKVLRNRVIGLGGVLDSARFKYYLSEALQVNAHDIEATVIGGHGDTTMVPLVSRATYKGTPVTELLPKEKLDEVVAATKIGGATLTGLLGISAWYAPGAAAAMMVECIVNDTKTILPCSVMLDGEYDQYAVSIGVPVVLGVKGWEKIVQLTLSKEEEREFELSVRATERVNRILSGQKVY